MPQQPFDPNEFAPKKKPPASVQKFPTSELLGTMWGTEDSILPPIKGITRPALPSSEGSDWQGWEDMKWLYENVARPSSSVVGAASDWLTGKAIGAIAKPIIGGAANLYKKFKGAPELPPIRNVEAPIAELPPVKPELLDDSGRIVAPTEGNAPLAERATGPWNQNVAELPPIKPDSPLPIPNRAPQLPEQPPVSAKYVFDQPTPEGGSIPMYNIENGPLHGTTVSAQTLEDMGLPVPEKTAPMQKPLTLEERQNAQLSVPEKAREADEILPADPHFNFGDPESPVFGNIKQVESTRDVNPQWRADMRANWGDMSKEEIARYIELQSAMNGPLNKITPEMHQEFVALQSKRPGPPQPDQYLLKQQAEQTRLQNVAANKGLPPARNEPFDPKTLGFEGAPKPFDEAEFVNPTTGEIIPESLAKPGDVPLEAPPTDVHFPPNPEKPLYHGTRRSFDEFSAKKGDESDFLGKWIHAAEDPDHAARVAIEPDIPVGKDGLVSAENLDPTTRPKPDFMTMPDSDVSGLNVRPVDVNRVNPLDVTHSALNNKIIQDAEAILKQIPMNSWGKMLLREAIQSAKHYMKPEFIGRTGDLLGEEVPQIARNLKDEMLRAVQNHPEIVKKSGFDALRYIDQPGWGNNYSVAVPSEFQVKSSFAKPPVGEVPGIAGRSATKRMGSPDLGLEGVPELPPSTAPELPVRPPQPPTLNTNALSRPAQIPDEPWSPVGAMPNEQMPLMDVAPQIPLQPAGVPRPPTPYQPAGVPITLGPPKPKAPVLGPQPPPPPIPPTPYQPAGIPKQLGPNPPKQPPMGPRKPPQPPANPLVPPPPPPPGPIRAALGAHKAWLTSLDLSAPGRQGKAFLFNKAWWTSLDDMGKAWWSKQGSDAVNDSIENHASGFFHHNTLPSGRQTQSWAEQMGLELPKHEEMFNNQVGKKFAEMTGIEKSSRAHTAFLNKLRSDQFASMIEASQKAGVDPIKRQDIAKAYAKFINDATGRGSVNFGSWKLERNMQMMNDVFFAPKNMSGQIKTWNNVLNPAKYYNYDPVLRKQALKSLFAVAGVGLGVGELARMAGAKVSNDPTSADFRKVKIGDTRIDMFGGYQQFPVAAMKLLTGESTSTISGKTTDLTAGRYGQQTRASVAERFFINRLSPVGSFIYAWMANREFDGKPFEVKRALFERTFPIAAKDIMELAQEDPTLAAIMAPTTVTGLTGTQHYTGR